MKATHRDAIKTSKETTTFSTTSPFELYIFRLFILFLLK